MKAKHILTALFIFAAFQLLPRTALCRGARSQAAGEEPPGLMTPAQHRQFLASLKTDLSRWQEQLAEIDVGALGLDYKRGKLIEDTLSLAKRHAEDCRKDEAALEGQQTLEVDIWLTSDMEHLSGSVGDLGVNLGFMGGDSGQARIWANELLVTQKEANEDRFKLFKHVIALATIADDQCPQVRRYLH